MPETSESQQLHARRQVYTGPAGPNVGAQDQPTYDKVTLQPTYAPSSDIKSALSYLLAATLFGGVFGLHLHGNTISPV